MIKYYGKHEYSTLAVEGYRPGRTGSHSVWLWMASGHDASINVGRSVVSVRGEGRQPYSWICVKSLSMKKGNAIRIQMQSVDADYVALIAICSSPTDAPAKHHPASSAHDRRPQAIPDLRAARLSDVNTPWTLKSHDSLDDWNARAGQIRGHILSTFGLSGGFPANPLKPRVFGRIEREGYSVEKVEFQSLPGFYCYGNLYRPTTKGPHPGVLCPHGHCHNGRFEDSDEAFASIPGRCINLARQGHVVFSYDMVGYNDSWQIPHRGLGGRLQDLWGIGVMGLQLINSSRSLDFLQTLPDVDPGRIGCTGASGGATQTFMLTAVDDRIKVAAPVNMISAHMQGGCNCENQAGLRVDINNVEIASTMAPRPMIMVSATGDWTVNTPDLEYPAVREIYRLFNAEDRIVSAQVDAGHNYNRESREHVYSFFGKWLLGIDDPERFREQPFRMEARPQLRVTHSRPRPSSALPPDGVQDQIKKTVTRQVSASKARTKDSLRQALGIDPDPDVSFEHLGQTRTPTHTTTRLVLDRSGDRIPALHLTPLGRKRATAVLFHPEGKSALFSGQGRPGPFVKSLLQSGVAVVAPDLFLTGESAHDSAPDRESRAGHFATYNLTDAQCRVQDMVTVAAYAGGRGGRVLIAGLKGTGVDTLLARPFMSRIHATFVDTAGTRPSSDAWWADHTYIPGIRQAGDITASAEILAPAHLALFSTGFDFPVTEFRKQYRARRNTGNLMLSKAKLTAANIIEHLK
jgi:dienelactone hydrolase